MRKRRETYHDDKTRLVNFLVDIETYKAFKIWCVANNTTVSAHIRGLVDKTLSGEITVEWKKRPVEKKKGELEDWLKEWD
jgi:uncharacterized membrane-anchored protein